MGHSVGGEGAEGARVGGAAVTPVLPEPRAGSSRTPADERRPFAASARSCSRWGRWYSGWQRSGSSVGSDPPHTRCRCTVNQNRVRTNWYVVKKKTYHALRMLTTENNDNYIFCICSQILANSIATVLLTNRTILSHKGESTERRVEIY